MEIESGKTEEKRSMFKLILYGILIIIVALVAVVLVARYAFNVELVNFDQLLGARISKSDLIKLQ